MSRILSHHVLLPLENSMQTCAETWMSEWHGRDFQVGPVKRIAKRPEELIPAQHKKLLRSVNRASLLMMAACQPLKEQFHSKWISDPFSIGIYCALESVPVDYSLAKCLAGVPEEKWPELFQSEFPPKNALKINLGMVPASLSLVLEAMGPATLFYDRNFGVLHSLTQAEQDLFENRVNVAVVCTAQALDDILMAMRSSHGSQDQLQCEGAAAVLLEKDGHWTDWAEHLPSVEMEFGISSPLIQLLNQGALS